MALATKLPSDDTRIHDWTPNTNYGSDTFLLWGGWWDIHMAMIKFDISDLPSNATSVKVKLYRETNWTNFFMSSLKWWEINSTWAEWTVTWNTKPTSVVNNTWTSVTWLPTSAWFIEIDITSLYNDWKNWIKTNNWIYINWWLTSYTQQVQRPSSKENATTWQRPYIEVEYTWNTWNFFQFF